MSLNILSETIIGACIEVHKHLGPGLLESAYEECLAYELSARGLRFSRQQSVPVVYKGMRLDCHYQLDLLVEEQIVLELKSVDRLMPVHEAQLLTYLKLLNLPLGLLVNFNVPVLVHGVKRMVNRYRD